MACSNGISITTENCSIPCQGYFANIKKHKDGFDYDYLNMLPTIYYENYTRMFGPSYREPDGLAHLFVKEIFTKKNLKFIRIFLDTPTFTKISRDKAAKFVDMLSAIGGTMGLLTGFSIISGIEIVYFMLKFLIVKLTKF